jgi:hypothetical protein
VGHFGCSLGFSSILCTAIVVAGGSWTSISGVRVTFHLISTFLLQELDQVALEFTLTRQCWPPSSALGLAIDGPELCRHWRSLAAIGEAWPPSAELGSHLLLSAAIGGAWPPSAAFGRHRRSLAAIGGAWQPSAAFGCHLRHSAAFGGVRLPPAALGRLRRRGAWTPS